MKKQIWAIIGAVTVLAAILSAFVIVPMFFATAGAPGPTSNSPTIIEFGATVNMFCYPLHIGPYAKNGDVGLFWTVSVEANVSAVTLDLVKVTIAWIAHNATGVHVGYVESVVHRAIPFGTTHFASGSFVFATHHPTDGLHHHRVWVIVEATDSTGTTTQTNGLNLPNCFQP